MIKVIRMAVPVLEVKNVAKTFDRVVHALNSVSIAVYENEIVGVVGENGAGKSTLMKILVGVFPPDRGEWYYMGSKIPFPKNPREAAKKGVAIVYQEKGIIPALRVYQYLFLGHEDRYVAFPRLMVAEMKRQAEMIVDEFNIQCSIDDFMYELPLSTQKMIEIARAILSLRLEHGNDHTASVVILDEPTAPLTIEERQGLFAYISNMKKTTSFILVSHMMHEVLEFTDRVYVLRDGALVSHYDLSQEKVTEEDLFRAIVGKASLEYSSKTEAPRISSEEVVLKAEDLSKRGSYYGLSFQLHRGECIGIFGPAGSGKSEIIRTIAGLIGFDAGALTVKGKTVKTGESPHVRLARGIGYFSGEIGKQLFFNWPVKENISIVNIDKVLTKPTRVINFSAERQMAERVVETFRIKTRDVNTNCRSLSGGNKQKVSAGRWFERSPDILLLEDPTIGIDVGARKDIYEAFLEMKNRGISMLLVSDDPKEYSVLCDRVILVRNGRLQREIGTREFAEAMST